MNDKNVITITKALQKILGESNRKPNKIWVDKGSEFCNRSMKSWIEKNDIEMYLAHNEGKFVVAKKFITTLRNKNYKYMISISINVYIDKSDWIVNKYNKIYHGTIKMKSVDVNPNMYINFNKENNKGGSKFKVGDHDIKAWKYKKHYKRLSFELVWRRFRD